jgi:hypothetical protein
MNDYETDDMETITGLLEGLEDESADDLAERRGGRGGRGGRWTNPQSPSGQSSYKPQPSNDLYVKKSELARTVMELEKKIKTVFDGVTKVNSRVNAVAQQQERHALAIKKESAKREKDIKDICQKLELLTLLPLVTGTTSKTITQDVRDGLAVGDKVLLDSGNSINTLLPLLLLGGCGGGDVGGGGLGWGGEGGTSSLILLLALSGGLGGRR